MSRRYTVMARLDRATCINAMLRAMARSSRAMTWVVRWAMTLLEW
jgi:hypothetical protein